MKLHDVLLNKITNTQEVNEIKIYTCGPTVYNYIHIGNTRPLFLVDTLIRYFKYKKISYNFLLNITDIDDKIIDKAANENTSEQAIAKKYTNSFLKDIRSLNLLKPTKIIPISKKMNEIIDFIVKLIHLKKAYVSNGNVYFDIESMGTEYGNLSKQKLTDLEQGTRKEIDSNKKNPLDFVLWKKTDKGLKWNSPWGPGRPGWHTECALLINDYFNAETIDIHVGGIDLKFPHHENERIQFLALTKKEIAKNWMHNGHLTYSGEKMSKSLGNTILVKEFLKDYSPNDLRYIFLVAPYSQPVNISLEMLTQATEWNIKILNLLKNFNILKSLKQLQFANNNEVELYKSEFERLMQDNLNTTNIISLINKILKNINMQIRNRKINLKMYKMFNDFLKTLGFKYKLTKISYEIKEKLIIWNKSLENKNYQLADKIRAELIEAGVL